MLVSLGRVKADVTGVCFIALFGCYFVCCICAEKECVLLLSVL